LVPSHWHTSFTGYQCRIPAQRACSVVGSARAIPPCRLQLAAGRQGGIFWGVRRCTDSERGGRHIIPCWRLVATLRQHERKSIRALTGGGRRILLQREMIPDSSFPSRESLCSGAHRGLGLDGDAFGKWGEIWDLGELRWAGMGNAVSGRGKFIVGGEFQCARGEPPVKRRSLHHSLWYLHRTLGTLQALDESNTALCILKWASYECIVASKIKTYCAPCCTKISFAREARCK